MKWVPPIPGGKLTSKPVRDLGSAVVFLHWCYEAVHRDGTIEFQVSEVADYLEESYYTVRKWWAAVKDGPWFAEVTDRGKRGYRVRMADDWIEWRAFKSPSSNGQMHNPVLDGDEVLVNAPSTQNEMHNPVLENNVYGTHNDHESSPPAASKNGKHTPNREMVMMLMGKGIQSQKVANEIAAKGLDYATVEQSIDNQIASGAGIGAIVKWLQDNPPEPGNPYPRTAIRPRNPAERVAQTVGMSRPPPAPADAVPARESAKRMLALRDQQRGVRPDD